MNDILFIKPLFYEKIWGGGNIKDVFKYDINLENVGECWAISGHPNGDCEILNGPHMGEKLSYVYHNYPHLFSNEAYQEFPLLAKIIDANDDLSIQVHPKDGYQHCLNGKTECWYVINASNDSKIQIGHNATSKEQLIEMVNDGNWDNLLNYLKVKKDDFIFVPSGTLHALCKNTMIYEIQQSSDITYRLYDYERLDNNGNYRQLHIEDAINVMDVPALKPLIIRENLHQGITPLIENICFSVYKWEDDLKYTNNGKYLLMSVIEGFGTINNQQIKAGDHFIVTSLCNEIIIKGKIKIIVSHK